MPVREGPPQPPPPPKLRRPVKMRPVDGPADRARGGAVILRSPARRIVMVAGLAGIVLLVLLLRLWA